MRYAFGSFVLDEPSRKLLRNGSPVSLEPRVFSLLLYLIHHRDRTVEASELLGAIWTDRKVTSASLTVAISALRKAISDSRTGIAVRTIRGSGYQFVAPVKASHQLEPQTRGYDATVPPQSYCINRERELSHVHQRLASSVRAAAPAVILFVGPPGVGKTTILNECLRIGTAAGWATHSVFCTDSQAFPPLWAWSQLVRSILAADTNPARVTNFPSAARGDLDRLLNLSISAEPSSANSRSSLHHSIFALLEAASKDTPLIVTVDDLHQADISSLGLLEFLCRNLRSSRIVFLCAARSQDANIGDAPTKLLRLSRDSRCLSLEVQNFSLTQVARFALHTLGRELPTDLADGLLRLTQGNPLLLAQITPQLQSLRSINELPQHSRDAIASRISRLPRPLQRVLALAAVLGSSFLSEDVANLARTDNSTMESSLSEAAQAQIVVQRSATSWAFCHELFREHLYSTLDESTRLWAHRHAVNLFANASQRNSRVDHSRLAYHCQAASSRDPQSEDASILLEEARFSLFDHSYERAIECAQVALGIARKLALGNALSLEILIVLGSAHARNSDRCTAFSIFNEAASLARQEGSAGAIARAALNASPGLLSIEASDPDPGLLNLLEQALSHVPEADDDLRACLEARASLALAWSSRADESRRLARAAMGRTSRTTDNDARCHALVAKWFAGWSPRTTDQRDRIAQEIRLACGQSRHTDFSLVAELLLATATLEAGDFQRHRFACARFIAIAEEVRHPFALWYAELLKATACLTAGRFGEAELWADAFQSSGRRAEDKNSFHSAMAHLLVRSWARGELESFVTIGEQAVREYPQLSAWRAALAWTYSQIDCLIEARHHMRLLFARGVEGIPMRTDWPFTMALAAEVAVVLKDPLWSTELYRAMTPMGDRMIVLGLCVVSLGSANRYLGLLANFLGHSSAAIRHYELARQMNAKAQALPWLVLSELELAEIESSNPRYSRDRSDQLRNSAKRTAAEIGFCAPGLCN